MINTYHTSLPMPPPPPPPVPPRFHSRPEPRQHSSLIWFLAVVLVIHMFLTFGGFIYLFHKGNQQELNENYQDDVRILKRLQQCDDDNVDDKTLLDCKKVLNQFKDVMAKASETESRVALLTGDHVHYHGALAHMSVSPAKRVANPRICTENDKGDCALEWNTDHSTKVNVDTEGDSRLRISHAGYYYIYSQVTFSIKNATSVLVNSIRHVKVKEQVKTWMKPEEIDEVLLRSYCPPQQLPLCTASQGGVFKLDKGDQLYVQVTNLNWVHYDRNATFFGLYELK
ncbi:CD40 ligand [Sardina pilchardus]|uniref:CD40 ligand n=1 Tax=Sardina pilchardus TaxID=27697 RepID=UPI002E15D884